MTHYLKKYSPAFLSEKDEFILSSRLRTAMPYIRFVDGQRWDQSTPPTCQEIAACRSSLVYLWNPDVCETLPFKKLPSGKYQGPTSGVVVQYNRSKRAETYLVSSDFGIGYDKNDHRIVSFVETVWGILNGFGRVKLACIDIASRRILKRGIVDYIVGPDAKAIATTGTLLKHSSAEVYYVIDS